MRALCCILLLYLAPTFLLSQTITGRIINVNDEKIPFATVVVKDSVNASTIKEYVLAKDGHYSITLTQTYQKFVIVVSANGYLPEPYTIDRPTPQATYHHDFSLVKDTVVKLPDVTVTAKVRPFQITGDTVKYNVSAYRDGSERKIQDVIKRLPGIQVDEKTGEIRYKGKSVETVKLDGEDLFSSNYTVGTKNINVDMVEQVQAIENYSDNPLLKGIESGDKVALNLTLKKNKTDYSGSIYAGMGLMSPDKAAADLSINVLGISKRFKSFGTLSYNNIGVNNTPFDYFSYSPNVEQIKEASLLAQRYIPDTYFNIALDAQRSNINRSLFGSYNSVFKLSKRLSVKTNLYYIQDKINSVQNYVTTNLINQQEFITSDRYDITKTPNQYRADIELKYNASATSLLEYKIRAKKEQINALSDVLQNDFTNYKTGLKTEDNLITQALTYTKKLGNRNALQLLAKQVSNEAPQNFTFLPAVYQQTTFLSNNQLSEFKKSSINFRGVLLGSTLKSKYSVSFGANYDRNYFVSAFSGKINNSSLPISPFDNNLRYQINNLYITGSYMLQVKHWRFMPSLISNYANQQLRNNVDGKLVKREDYFMEPSFSIGYKLGSYSGLLLTTGYKQKPFTEDYLIAGPVYISTRIVKSNEVSLNFQKSTFASLFYVVNDLYRQFQLNVGGSFFLNHGNYFSDITVQPNITELIYFYLPEESTTLSVNFLAEKYIPLLQGTLRLSSDFTSVSYKNIVNNSTLRNNITNTLITSLFFKTAFDGKINFENTLKHRMMASKVEGGTDLSNQSLNNNFQIIVKPTKRSFFLISTDFYQPDLKLSNQHYFFLDASLHLSTKRNLYDWRFTAKNVTNTKTFRQIETNDFSKTSVQTDLLPGYFLLSVTRHF